MKSKVLLAILVLATSASPISASVEACISPIVPSIPEGSSSTEPEMVDGVKAFKEYQALASAYRECLDKLIIEPEADVSDEAKKTSDRAVELYNESVQEETLTADELNSQIRAFKGKSS